MFKIKMILDVNFVFLFILNAKLCVHKKRKKILKTLAFPPLFFGKWRKIFTKPYRYISEKPQLVKLLAHYQL